MFNRLHQAEKAIAERIKQVFEDDAVVNIPEIREANGESFQNDLATLNPNGLIRVAYQLGRVDKTLRDNISTRKATFVITFISEKDREAMFDWMERVDTLLSVAKIEELSSPLVYQRDQLPTRVTEIDAHIADIVYTCLIKR